MKREGKGISSKRLIVKNQKRVVCICIKPIYPLMKSTAANLPLEVTKRMKVMSRRAEQYRKKIIVKKKS